MTLPAGVQGHLRGLRHVGVVTDDLDTLVARLQAVFGIADGGILRVPAAGEPAETRFAFFSIGGVPYEVIEPVSPQFRALLLGSNRGANHVCYNVDNLDAAVAAMAAAGVRLGHVTPDGILDMPHARMAYFNPADTAGLLIEFVEPRA
jgi:methylmalonyl-CoA/ethylmalonyl-CoA epimerase